jgi:hypothetical protein
MFRRSSTNTIELLHNLISGAESHTQGDHEFENTALYVLNLKSLIWRQITNNLCPALVRCCTTAMCDGDLYLYGAVHCKKQFQPILLRLDIKKLMYHHIPVNIDRSSLTQVAVGRGNELYLFNSDECASLYKIVLNNVSRDQRVKFLTVLELSIFCDCVFIMYAES